MGSLLAVQTILRRYYEDMATYTRSRDWPRARASISEIAHLARAAREAVEAIAHVDDGAPVLNITVKMPGVEDSSTSEAEFTAGVTAYPLDRLVVTILARTGWNAASEAMVVIYLGSDVSGARMYVSGSDRRWVDGTAAIISDAVHGVALRPRSRWYRPLAFVLMLGAEIVALSALWASWTSHSIAVAAIAGAVCAGVATYLFGSLGLLGRRVLPKFTLVNDGVEDASARRRRLAKRVAGTVLVLVAGAVISALANKWIH